MIVRDHDGVVVSPTRFTDEFMCFGLSTALSPAFRTRFDAALVDELPRLSDSDPFRVATPLADVGDDERNPAAPTTTPSNASGASQP